MAIRDFFPGEVRQEVEEDFAATYDLFDRLRAYLPTKTACVVCGGVDSHGQPIDPTCATCSNGYTWTWVIQEFQCRVADVTLVTQFFFTITPGIEIGDKLLFFSEYDQPLLTQVLENDSAYIQDAAATWQPRSVQFAQVGRHPEWIAHLRKHSPEVTYG